MYISKIRLENIRRYHDTTIELSIGKSVLICGNNGSGKSSLLRSIAMGVCDQASSGALLRDLTGDFIRKSSQPKSEREAHISIELANSSDDKYLIRTDIKTKADAIFETVRTSTKKNDSAVESNDFPWEKIFITAYGPGLRTEGAEDYVQYFPADAVYSLFDYTYPLQNPELAWRRFIDAARNPAEKNDPKGADSAEEQISGLIANELKKILALDTLDDEISLENNGIFVKSSWGKQELSALGDGYRSLITLILDILSWNLLFQNHEIILKNYENNEEQIWNPITDFTSIEGIIVIDEIEKHLHPKLQHNIISHLKDVFPKVQFIISTHS
ncbi:MAG: AAA family ATPase, partial [Flavisolibacter sp.]